MANPLDPAGLYQRYKAAQVGRGLGDLFQEEGPGLGPSSKLSEIISGLRGSGEGQIKSGMDPRIVMPSIERRILEETQDEGLRRIKESAPKGLDEAYDRIKRLQKGPNFASPEDEMSGIRKRQARQAEAERITPTSMFSPFGDPPMPMGVGPNELSPLDAIAEQLNKAASDKKTDDKKNQTAEEFRAEEAKIAEMAGMPTQKVVEDLFKGSMDEYLKAARGAGPDSPEEKTLDDYKKEFAEATGIDVSGKVDKSAAMIAFGLSMMQNRAGKGFNVGSFFRTLGEAGEAALPALEKAKAQAKEAGLAAGKYALEMRSADETKRAAAAEKAMERSNYYIIPKGEGVSGAIANLDQGRLETLSKYEINQLLNNPEFASKYDILPGSTWASVVEEAMKTPEAKQLYDTKSARKLELFGEGASDLFTIETWRALPNSGVDNILVGSGADTYKALAEAARDINKAKEQFITGMDLAEGVNIFRFGVDKLDALASTLGFNMREGLTPTQQLKFILDKLQAQNAPAILGEAGKTISDADRARVAQIVGELNAGSTADEITFKLNQLFNDIIIKKERDILSALETLDRYTGKNVSGMLSPSQELSEEDEAERIEGLKSLGIEV